MAKAPARHHETAVKTDVLIGGAGFAGLALGYRAAPGAGRELCRDGGRPGAERGAVEGPARLRDRGRSAAAVRGDRGLGRGRADGAADPRHGGDRFETRRRGAADLPHLRRRGGAGRAVRAHGREPASDRCAGRPRRKSSASTLQAAAVERVRTDAAHGIDVRSPAAKRFPRGCWSAPTARARKSASRPASPRMAGTTTSRPSSPRSRMSATMTAAPRSISFPPGRSPSCR